MSTPVPLLLATCVGCAPATPQAAKMPAPSPSTQPVPSANLANQKRLVRAAPPHPTAPDRATAVGWSKAGTRPQPKSMLLYGSRGQAVVYLQTRLRQLGYAVGAIDGIFGPRTKAAVAQFQRSQKLQADGAVGVSTWAKLQSAQRPMGRTQQNTPLPTRSRNHSVSGRPTPPTQQPRPKATQPAPAPPELLPLSSQSARTFRIDNTPLLSESGYAWLIGWVVIQGLGWLVILRDLNREIRGFRVEPIRDPEQDFQAALRHGSTGLVEPLQGGAGTVALPKQGATTQTVSVQRPVLPGSVLPQQPMQLPGAPAPITPALPEVDPGDRVLEVIDAADGLEPTDLFNRQMPGSETPRVPSIGPTVEQTPVAVKSARSAPSTDDTADEVVVARLAIADNGNPDRYTYSLVDDADGLFVLRGQELRCKQQRLKRLADRTQTITVCRTDAQGNSVHKSFQCELQQPRQSVPVA